MSDIRDFKRIADGIMSNINASEELKRKTLDRCMKRRHVLAGRLLVPAACLASFVLIMGVMNISGLLRQNPPAGMEGNVQDNRIMVSSAENTGGAAENNKIFSAEAVNDADLKARNPKEWVLETPDEARNIFGSGFLAPSYIPEGFNLEKIRASGPDDRTMDKVELVYFAGDKWFVIVEEKGVVQGEFTGFQTVDINGSKGFLRAEVSDTGGNRETYSIELRWFKDGVGYSITGLLKEEEAVKVAVSMN